MEPHPVQSQQKATFGERGFCSCDRWTDGVVDDYKFLGMAARIRRSSFPTFLFVEKESHDEILGSLSLTLGSLVAS